MSTQTNICRIEFSKVSVFIVCTYTKCYQKCSFWHF